MLPLAGPKVVNVHLVELFTGTPDRGAGPTESKFVADPTQSPHTHAGVFNSER